MYDLIIRGGTLVDGSGDEPRKGDVAIQDGVICAVGTVDGEARHFLQCVLNDVDDRLRGSNQSGNGGGEAKGVGRVKGKQFWQSMPLLPLVIDA